MLPKNSQNSFFLKNKNNQNCPNSHKIFWLLFKKTFGQELLKTVQSGHAEVCCCNCEERDNPWCLLSSITITSYKTSGRAEWQFKSAQQRRRRRRRRWNGVINRHDGLQVGQTTSRQRRFGTKTNRCIRRLAKLANWPIITIMVLNLHLPSGRIDNFTNGRFTILSHWPSKFGLLLIVRSWLLLLDACVFSVENVELNDRCQKAEYHRVI